MILRIVIDNVHVRVLNTNVIVANEETADVTYIALGVYLNMTFLNVDDVYFELNIDVYLCAEYETMRG